MKKAKKEKGKKEKEENKAQKVVCIICNKEKSGTPIKEDIVIRTIRRIKEALRISTGNKLVVCNEHIEEAKKRREKFEKSILTYGGIGAVLGIILVILAIFSQKSIVAILQTIVLLIFLVLVMAALSLYQYFPAIEEAKGASAKKRK